MDRWLSLQLLIFDYTEPSHSTVSPSHRYVFQCEHSHTSRDDLFLRLCWFSVVAAGWLTKNLPGVHVGPPSSSSVCTAWTLLGGWGGRTRIGGSRAAQPELCVPRPWMALNINAKKNTTKEALSRLKCSLFTVRVVI